MLDIGENSLQTGYMVFPNKDTDALYNCSAIILAKPLAGALGLYHYPSGKIKADQESQALIREMVGDIDPTEIYIVYGSSGTYGEKEQYVVKLAKWIETVAGVTPVQQSAEGVSVRARIGSNGKVEIGKADFHGAIDLWQFSSGLNADGNFKVYWNMQEIGQMQDKRKLAL